MKFTVDVSLCDIYIFFIYVRIQQSYITYNSTTLYITDWLVGWLVGWLID